MTDKVASVASYIGGGVAVVGGLGLNEVLAIGGFVIAILGFCYNIWYKERMLKELKKKDRITITQE